MKSNVLKSVLSIILCFSMLFSFAAFFEVNAQGQEGTVYNLGGYTLKVRTGPSTEHSVLKHNGSEVRLQNGDNVIVLSEHNSDINDSSNPLWYKIQFNYNGASLIGYASATYVKIKVNTDPMPEGIPEIYKEYIDALLEKHPNWNFVFYDTGYEWNEVLSEDAEGALEASLIQGTYPISYRSTQEGAFDFRNDKWIPLDGKSWYQANTQTIAYYMDPRNFLNEETVFMFESLSYDSNTQTLDGVASIIKGTFMEKPSIKNTDGEEISYAQAYIDAAVYSKVSPYHLASRTRQEVGVNGSGSTSGKYSGYEGYYNYYNIGANAGTAAVANGLSFAKNGTGLSDSEKKLCYIPWNTPYKSIMGGAYWIGSKYINSVHKQNTLYFQKFNTSNPNYAFYHQYMQNIMAPAHEAPRIYSSYEDMGVLENEFTFIIPYYRNMPKKACELPESNNFSPNNWLSSLSVEGQSISFDGNKTSYNLTVPQSVSSVRINATAVNSKAKISGTGTSNLSGGLNVIDVVVTAENGVERIYRLNITRSVENEIPLKSISLNKTSVTMFVGDTQTLSISYNPSNTTADKTVAWTSSDTSVATVKNGVVTVHKKGTATITAKVGSFTAECKITVTDDYKVGDIDADGSVTIADSLMIFKYKTGEIKLSDMALKAADTDRNGKVELADALRIFKFKSGEIDKL